MCDGLFIFGNNAMIDSYRNYFQNPTEKKKEPPKPQ